MSTTDANTKVQQSYDKIAKVYTEWVESNPSPRLKYLNKVLGRLPDTGSTILELGCGAGVPVTQALAKSEKIAKVVANDISPGQIQLAREKVPGGKVEFIASDMLSLDIEKGSLDVVVAFYSIFHLSRDEQPIMLEKIHSWLKAGGFLVLSVGTDDTVETKNEFFGEEMRWSGWGVEGMLEMIRTVGGGFEVVESEVLDGFDPGDGGEEMKDEDRGEKDPDFGVKFLWVVARKRE